MRENLKILFVIGFLGLVVSGNAFIKTAYAAVTINVKKIAPEGDRGYGKFSIDVLCNDEANRHYDLGPNESTSFVYPDDEGNLECYIEENLTSAQSAVYSKVYGDDYDVSDGHILAQIPSTTNGKTLFVTNTLISSPTTAPAPHSDPGSGPAPALPPSCDDIKPGSNPTIFQIDRINGGTSAVLHFVPSGNPVSYYYISYGLDPNATGYGVSFPYSTSTGAITYAINALDPKATYYFKVRAGNGCATGEWSGVVANNKYPGLPHTGHGNNAALAKLFMLNLSK